MMPMTLVLLVQSVGDSARAWWLPHAPMNPTEENGQLAMMAPRASGSGVVDELVSTMPRPTLNVAERGCVRFPLTVQLVMAPMRGVDGLTLLDDPATEPIPRCTTWRRRAAVSRPWEGTAQ